MWSPFLDIDYTADLASFSQLGCELQFPASWNPICLETGMADLWDDPDGNNRGRCHALSGSHRGVVPPGLLGIIVNQQDNAMG